MTDCPFPPDPCPAPNPVTIEGTYECVTIAPTLPPIDYNDLPAIVVVPGRTPGMVTLDASSDRYDHYARRDILGEFFDGITVP